MRQKLKDLLLKIKSDRKYTLLAFGIGAAILFLVFSAGDPGTRLKKKQVAKAYTSNTESYRLYLQGEYYWNKRDIESGAVKTANGEWFSYENHCQLAYLIYTRWGCDFPAAASAWRRLFQNGCSDGDFLKMVRDAGSEGGPNV